MIFFCEFLLMFFMVVPMITTNSIVREHMKLAHADMDDDIKTTFAKLLHSIVKINEERVGIMNKLFKLQDYKPLNAEFVQDLTKKGDLRKGIDSYEVSEEIEEIEKHPVVIMIRNTPNKIKLNMNNSKIKTLKQLRSNSKQIIVLHPNSRSMLSYSESYKHNSANNNKTHPKMYRRAGWRGCCDKKASKVCSRACKDALRNICKYYKCSRRMKSAGNKECKRSCKANFIKGAYSDDE